MDSDQAIVMRLERELLDPGTRADATRIAALLGDEFVEVGVTGLRFGKAEVVEWLPAESGKSFAATSMQAVALGEGVILVTYTAEKTHQGTVTRSLRSSLWVKAGDAWRLRYHQGTAADR